MSDSLKITKFKEQISSLNHPQITNLVNLVLDKIKQNQSVKFSHEFQNHLNFWSEVNEKGITFRAEAVEQTMDLFYSTFRRDDFKKGQGFALYVDGFIELNRDKVADLMRLSCKILGAVQQKDVDSQNEFFQFFPPQSQDLNCLDGTLERIEITERDLFLRKDLDLFADSHQVAIRNAADFLGKDVHEGNHVHLIKYLEYTLGIGDQNSIHAQSQIPFYKSVEFYQEYSQAFKYFLLKKLDSEIEERKKDIYQRISFVNEILQPSDQKYFAEVNSALKTLNPRSLNIFKEDETEIGRFFIYEDGVQELAEDHPAIDFFDSQKVQQTLTRTKLTMIGDEEYQQYQQQQAELRKDFSANPSQFFLIDSTEKFLSLINPQQQYPEMISDKIFAFDHLWMAGEQLLSAPNHFFISVFRSLREADLDFFEKSKIELMHFLPAIDGKIDRIEDNYERLIQSSVYSDSSHIITMSEMIDLGFPSELVKSQITELRTDNNREWYLLENAEENYQIRLMSILVARPDAEEVIDCLIENKIECEEERLFFKKLLNALSKTSNVDLCRHVFEKLSHDSRYFEGSAFFHNIAYKDSFEIIPDITDFIKSNPSILDGGALVSAVKFGSADFTKLYSEIIEPTRQQYFGLCRIAIDHNQIKSLKELFVKVPEIIRYVDSSGNNLLHYQAISKQESFLIEIYNVCQRTFPDSQDLLRQLVHSKNRLRVTPFDSAVKCDDVEGIKFMMDKLGADPFIVDSNGFTPPLKALVSKKEKVVTEFVKRGIYKEIYANTGGIIFTLLRSELKNETIFLIKCGEDVNYSHPEHAGNTALHQVILSPDLTNKADSISLLSSLRADLTIKNGKGLNPLEIAFSMQNQEAERAIFSAFSRLFYEKNIDRIQNFIDAGLNPNILLYENGDTLPHNFIKKIAEGRLSDYEYYGDEIDNFINQFGNLGFDFTRRNHQGFTYDYPLLDSPYPTFLDSLPAERFNFLFYEVIFRENLKGLTLLYDSSKIRNMSEPPIDSENIFCKNFNRYLAFALEYKLDQKVIAFLDSKASELQIVREDVSEEKIMPHKQEMQNQTVSDFILEESNGRISPPSTDPVRASSKNLSQQTPSNDNSESR